MARLIGEVWQRRDDVAIVARSLPSATANNDRDGASYITMTAMGRVTLVAARSLRQTAWKRASSPIREHEYMACGLFKIDNPPNKQRTSIGLGRALEGTLRFLRRAHWQARTRPRRAPGCLGHRALHRPARRHRPRLGRFNCAGRCPGQRPGPCPARESRRAKEAPCPLTSAPGPGLARAPIGQFMGPRRP